MGVTGDLRAAVTDIFRVPAVLDASLNLPILYLSDREARISGRVNIQSESLVGAQLGVTIVADGKRLANKEIPFDRRTGEFSTAVSVVDLSPGRYEVELELRIPSEDAQPIAANLPLRLVRGPVD
jgi:hypothetical protein